MSMDMEKKKSKRLIAFGIIFLLIGIWGTLKTVVLSILPVQLLFTKNLFSNIQIWFSSMLPMVKASFLFLSIGVFMRLSWTPIIAVVLASIQGLFYISWIPVMISATFKYEGLSVKALVTDLLSMFIVIAFQVYMVYYFTRPKVKEQFK